MLTIFTIPKPFKGHDGVIQKNAIRSWANLQTPCQIILVGNDEGTAEMAAEVGALHLPDVEMTDFGTPYLDDAFNQAQEHATFEVMCYLNADIMIFDDLLQAAAKVRGKWDHFLMVGQRTDIDMTEEIAFSGDWRSELRLLLRQDGFLQHHSAMDYFVFPRGQIDNLPHFAVGRPAWDTWMIYNALKSGFALVDATQGALVVHQNHGYGHVPLSRGAAWNGPEGDENLKVVRAIPGYAPQYFTTNRAPWRVDGAAVQRNSDLASTLRRFKSFLYTRPFLGRVLRRLMTMMGDR